VGRLGLPRRVHGLLLAVEPHSWIKGILHVAVRSILHHVSKVMSRFPTDLGVGIDWDLKMERRMDCNESHGGLACISREPDADVAKVISLLEQAVASLDQSWQEEILRATPHAVTGLGEASRSVHLALIALSQND
jgi:hypothetical protein